MELSTIGDDEPGGALAGLESLYIEPERPTEIDWGALGFYVEALEAGECAAGLVVPDRAQLHWKLWMISRYASTLSTPTGLDSSTVATRPLFAST